MGMIKVLIVDDEHYTRKVIRTLLMSIGCTKIYEAGDGADGLEPIRAIHPDIVLLDWEMPGSTAPTSCAGCARPHVSAAGRSDHHAHRPRRALARARGGRLGVHEFLLKPVSSKALQSALLSVLTKPRTMVSVATITGRSRASWRLQAGGRRLTIRAHTTRSTSARLRDIVN